MKYTFQAKVWKHKGPAGWYFVNLPKALSMEIRSNYGLAEEGWGRLKIIARAGRSKWETSIWYDRKAGGYLLPVKASVRKAEKINEGDRISFVLTMEAVDPREWRWRRPAGRD